MRSLRIPLLAALSIPTVTAGLLACGADAPPPATPPAPSPVATATAPAPTVAYDPNLTGPSESALDRSVKPCDDFYQFACGGWMKSTPVPDDEARWTRGFSVIAEENQEALRGILERDAAGDSRGDAYGKELGAFWASCMDEANVEKRGASDLKPELERIARIGSDKALVAEMAHLHTMGVGATFDTGSEPDAKDASHMLAVVAQGGLGLPERDYYFRDDAKSKELRAAYEKHVAATLELLGEKPTTAAENAKTVLRVETELAGASLTRVERRDPKKVYHRMTRDELKALAPAMAWDGYLADVGFPAISAFNVAEPEFFKKVDAMTKGVPLRDWKTYLRWHLARATSPYLSKAFVDEWFHFQQTLSGVKTLQPRWKRCVKLIDASMGEALAQPFVADHLGADGREMAVRMVSGIETSMKKDLEGLVWMDDATRTQAEDKLAKVVNKIGYPLRWRSYDNLKIGRDSLVGNVVASSAFELHRELAKAGQPTDKEEWGMTPPTVNAYYNPSLNEMVFPAGILQLPFYGRLQSPAMNFGGIGLVVGHELTHGFDDQGRKFDADGNLRDWWTAPVSAEFDRRAACVEHQFDDYVAVDDLHLKGKLTLGENIADLGGLKLAYAAFQRSEHEHPASPPLDGFTPDQEFFMGFAQSWCANTRPEELRSRAQTDPHSPPKYRVDGPLSNFPEFGAAFSCKAGDAMARPADKRCTVW